MGARLELNAFACFGNLIPHTGWLCQALTEGMVFSITATYYSLYFGGFPKEACPILNRNKEEVLGNIKRWE